MEGTLRLGRIAGIPVGIHYTWLFAFLLVAGTLAVGYFEPRLPERFLLPWILGAVASVGLFVSVLLHELAHSVVALSFGLPVQSITLFIFGGVSQIGSEAEEPKHEFLIAIVGPLTSFALAGAFWLILQFVPLPGLPWELLIGYLALVNLLLGIFNLLPGFPLDGGRVLRSIVWGVSRSIVTGTNVASYVGQAFAWLLIIWGVWRVLAEGDLLGGLWTGFIGWFLNSGAEASRRQIVMRDRYQRVPIAPLIRPNPPVIAPETRVVSLVHEFIVRRGLRAMPVVDDGRLVGIVTISDVKELPADQWDSATVGEIMTREPLVAVPPDAGLADVLQLLDERDVNQVLIVQDGRLFGILSRADVLRFMAIREELGPRSLQVPPLGRR